MISSPSDALRVAYGQLSRVEYAALATSSPSGEPWNSPVYTAYDDELNLYWTSAASSMHSQNVRSSGRAFLVIYNSTAPEGTGEGLYLRCNARELDRVEEVARGRRILVSRIGKADRPPTEFLGESPRRVYRATPLQAWVNDNEVHGDRQVDVRLPVDLAELRQYLRSRPANS
ncbi:MAG TPA: pyridoxamine 5'-phosphate oxidase family protein [Mycobacteriales bacterium]|nr:pyridoxamine 5'-phosphate oxidase family protein [Mycobacteriales bacterium]